MKKLFSFIALCAFFLLACNNSETKNSTDSDTTLVKKDTTMQMPDTAAVPLTGHAQASIAGTYADTAVSGMATFDTVGGKVKMLLELTVMAKAGKSIAVHIHEHGDCGEKGTNAHGHWNPGNNEHGKWGSANFHAGDIGNVKLDANGKGTLKMESDRWTLGGSYSTNILGKAIIVHGGTDDFTTQPTGNAGGRIGCGVIQ